MATTPVTTQPFECPECKRTFSAPTALGYHRRVMHGIPGKFHHKHQQQKQRAASKVHKRSSFVCPKCGKAYSYAKALGKHMSAVHHIAGKSKSAVNKRKEQEQALVIAVTSDLTCSVCGKGPFKTHSGLMIHKSTMQHHQGGASPNGNSSSNPNEVATAFWIARTATLIEQLCAANAERVNFAPAEFTARVMAVVQGSSKTLRQLYRLPDNV